MTLTLATICIAIVIQTDLQWPCVKAVVVHYVMSARVFFRRISVRSAISAEYVQRSQRSIRRR